MSYNFGYQEYKLIRLFMNKVFNKIEATDRKISGRSGLGLFIEYVRNTKFIKYFKNAIGDVKGSSKGLSEEGFISQMLAYFIDGTDMSISGFDRKKRDKGYAAAIGNEVEEMASSHQIKRFFRNLRSIGNLVYRKISHKLFVWRLNQEEPDYIELRADVMPMDNDDAKNREKATPTYKGKKGFAPYQVTWDGYIVDAIFREGKKHSNNGNDFVKSIGKLVKLIRDEYRDVPIIVLSDTGFESEFNFKFFDEKLGIHFVSSGKKHEYVQEIGQSHLENGDKYSKGREIWEYTNFGLLRKSWDNWWRAIYTRRLSDKDGQKCIGWGKTESLIFTNIGQNKELDNKLQKAAGENYLSPGNIIELFHSQGKHELIHRSLKEFATKEQLPFKGFGMNRAYYYIMLFSYFLFESYKSDISEETDLSTVKSMYPDTFRRKFIDFAGNIVKTGNEIILKIVDRIYKGLRIDKLWELCQNSIPI